ncbi:hypothetical protein CK489_35260 [Bradyrhizobium sp. UFLA03-84]|uniref:hypothetical protein n=1 Tax=Bradyrhizobium sp. UFLA03-84 TaxID=418599 RepID=UPI000BAE1DCA|nr:hypothetical protein [Bradyrhizobium sp. UFLA03-84]PAY04493.1 hypothetical protein CK489_35260 [Bradyrhizobium sp. UFLA03-84]
MKPKVLCALSVVAVCAVVLISLTYSKWNAPIELTATILSTAERMTRLEESERQVRARLESMPGRERKMPDLRGTLVDVTLDRHDDGPMGPVSAARIGAHEFLIANYQDIFLFDQDRRTAVPVQTDVELPVWNPTAVFYSAFYDRVFIANYSGKDIVVAQLVRDGGGPKLHLTDRIVNEAAIQGAEGVAVSKGGRFMAIADYEGNALSLFERIDDQWAFRWKREIIGSHGVAIAGDYVFASGQGAIVKFSIETGQEAARTSKLGSEPILFATCLNVDESSGQLIGSDAMSGIVFGMTKDLKVTSKFGANGPTYSNFSSPFCAYRDRQGIYVLSTYQDRFVSIGRDSATSYEFSGAQWRYIDFPFGLRNASNMLHGAVQFDRPSYRMFDKNVRAGYGGLYTDDGKLLLMPGRQELFDGASPFYVTSIASNSTWLVIVANSSPRAMLYNRKTGELGAVTIGEWDCWATAADVLCPSRRYSVDELSAQANLLEPEQQAAAPGGWTENAIPIIQYWAGWKLAQGPRAVASSNGASSPDPANVR